MWEREERYVLGIISITWELNGILFHKDQGDVELVLWSFYFLG